MDSGGSRSGLARAMRQEGIAQGTSRRLEFRLPSSIPAVGGWRLVVDIGHSERPSAWGKKWKEWRLSVSIEEGWLQHATIWTSTFSMLATLRTPTKARAGGGSKGSGTGR